MRVLCTGAAGFLGSAICKRLVAAGHEVEGLDLLHPAEAWRLEGLNLANYRWSGLADVRDVPPYVIHTAAATDVAQTARSPRYALEQTLMGTTALLEACRHTEGFQRFVLISSYSAYGVVEKQPIREDAPLRPRTIYGAVKAAQEQLAMAYFHSHGVPVTVIRCSTMYGEFGRASTPVAIFLRKSLADEEISITLPGSQTRDQNHVSNAVDGILAALATGVGWHSKAVGEVFNIGSGEEMSILKLAELCNRTMARTAGKSPTNIALVPARAGEEGRLVLDIEKAREVLGYTPKVRLEEGIVRTAKWVLEQARVS